MSSPIHYGKQQIDQDDVKAVVDTLNSAFLTQGPQVAQFEQALANYVGSTHAIACSNGTAALHLACLALGIGQGDTVWTSAISFVASANCALYCGASIRFIDIDPNTGNISLKALAAKLHQSHKTNTLPKAIVVVHLAGNSCDMQAIYKLCNPLGIKLIEDSCHALGASYQGAKIGSGKYSDCCVFSFHPVKSITSAEGGMITANDANLANRLKQLASHGITKDPQELTVSGQPQWYYEQQSLGYNYRLSDLQAALGLSQLAKLDTFIERRQQIFNIYQEAFSAHNLSLLEQNKEGESAHHLVVLLIPNNQRDTVYRQLADINIHCQLHYIPIYRQPYHRISNAEIEKFAGAEQYFKSALSLPVYPDLSHQQQQRVINSLLEIINE
ncbi:UDP-4-amino-4,6-dideoxy-N-acetyl-beta-L-altrosamine transaminase [Agarivorans albus]|uniref:Legionaminic acid biosynthesis aminotransferase PglE n=1 Tax=Agarivorans albus MKT 106 TaxID=1331007 RepID=R9PN24_AGAAL|nr:UDP-4-amino-4,6-dideoxy-N-acetyl-beta-L-altrosamine transaminase [Agarivorans albus]GAD02678.1 legionaminic acid biosynthesis aminotransferase PglE [Agarivorans albus MKT 106]